MHDWYRAGEGALEVRLFGLPLKRLRGEAVTKGEAMRYLAELPLAPAAMAHNHELEWREVDKKTVEVATSVAGPRLTVLLHFDDAGDVVAATVCGLSAAKFSAVHGYQVVSVDLRLQYEDHLRSQVARADGQTYLGRLAFGARTLDLEGRHRDAPAIDRQFGYEKILSLRMGSRGADRLDRRPVLVMERADGRYLVTSAGMGAGIVQEVADRLAGLHAAARRSGVQPGSCP